jgi:hypothetical protein
MIARLGGALLDRAVTRRRRALERVSRDAIRVQEATLRAHVRTARDTEFGLAHGFASVRGVADYQTRVPLRDYLGLEASWQAALAGATHVTWPGRPRLWVKTSGTTAGDKVIPVTSEAYPAHRRGGWDALLMAAQRVGSRVLLEGSMLMLGGSTALQPAAAGALVGDLSGVMARRLPPGIRSRYSPGSEIASIPDWEARIAKVAALVEGQDLRLVAGMPSWLLIMLEHVAHRRETAGRADALAGLWPDLRAFVHGGVSFEPYRDVFEARLGRRLEYVEVYPASEGFVAVQTERSGGLTLMLDYGVFYEFVPVEDLGLSHLRRHTVADVELDRPYAVVLTTPAGIWSYILGDTVRFIARDPLRLVITGRTRHFANAFGENVIVEEVEHALVAACRATGADVAEFTVAPRFPELGEPRGGHDWLVEFRALPIESRRVCRRARRRAAGPEHRLPHEAGGGPRHAGAAAARAAVGDVPPLDAGGRQARQPAQGPPGDERPPDRRRAAGERGHRRARRGACVRAGQRRCRGPAGGRLGRTCRARTSR